MLLRVELICLWQWMLAFMKIFLFSPPKVRNTTRRKWKKDCTACRWCVSPIVSKITKWNKYRVLHSREREVIEKRQKPLQVYSRNRKGNGPLLSSIPSSNAPNLDPDPFTSSSEVVPHTGIFPDLDIPVVLCKGSRSCVTHHPIHNVVSSNHLSPVYQTFISNLASECIPKHVLEALTHTN